MSDGKKDALEVAAKLQRGGKLTNAATIDRMLHEAGVTERLRRIAIGSFNADRLAAQIILATRRTPKLLECTQESLFLALLEAMRCGLEPDGVQGALVPFRDKGIQKAQFMPMYQGIVGALIADRVVSSVVAEVVHEHDLFVVRLGTVQEIEHTPAPFRLDGKRSDERGPPIAAYAAARLPDASHTFRVMTAADVEKRRAASKSGDNEDGPWVNWPAEMWRKTALKGLSKWLGARTARLRTIMEADDRAEMGRDPPPQVEAKIKEREHAALMAKREEWDAADEADPVRAALPASADDDGDTWEEHRRRAEEEADKAFARIAAEPTDDTPPLPGIPPPSRREPEDR